MINSFFIYYKLLMHKISLMSNVLFLEILVFIQNNQISVIDFINQIINQNHFYF